MSSGKVKRTHFHCVSTGIIPSLYFTERIFVIVVSDMQKIMSRKKIETNKLCVFTQYGYILDGT